MALPVSETGCTPLKHQHLSGLAGVLDIGYSISSLSPQWYGKSQVQCMYIGYLLVNMLMNLRHIARDNDLPYAPGELQMESETEGCLHPCGGAI
jgi:hypothetical protein